MQPSEEVRPLIAGRYRLLDRIGEGGMAEVWRAEDVRLARQVAIKLLTLFADGETEEERVHRFLREARIAAAVRHKNVVDVLDFGTSEDGRPFMAMELLVGESLEHRLLRTPPITLGELIDVALGALDGLEAVHRAGVVHRDLKPDNVFLLDDDGCVRPKLLDFGVSRALDRREGRRSVLTTMQGRLVGTPEYMSPEQARGHSDVDARTDIYSLGVILYEALTGRLPYEAAGLGDLIIAIAMGGAPSVVEVRPDVGSAISDVIERAMSVSREDRWQSARQMRSALAEAAIMDLGREGRDARGSLPSPTLARHELRNGRGASGVISVTGPADTARRGPRTPPSLAVDPVASVPPPRARSTWMAAAAAGVVALAGVGSWALVSAGSQDATVASAPAAEPTSASPAPSERAPVASSTDPFESDQASSSRLGATGDATSAAPSAPSVVESAVAESAVDESAVEESANAENAGAPRHVRVTLHGVPRGARVTVDGEAAALEGGAVRVPRDEAPHHLVVRAGAARWGVRHVADEDGDYRVHLRRPAPRPPAAEEAPSDPTLFRELDY